MDLSTQVPIRSRVRISRLNRSNSDVGRYLVAPVRRCVNAFRNALTRQYGVSPDNLGRLHCSRFNHLHSALLEHRLIEGQSVRDSPAHPLNVAGRVARAGDACVRYGAAEEEEPDWTLRQAVRTRALWLVAIGTGLMFLMQAGTNTHSAGMRSIGMPFCLCANSCRDERPEWRSRTLGSTNATHDFPVRLR